MDEQGNVVGWSEFNIVQDLWNEMAISIEELLFHLQLKLTGEDLARKHGKSLAAEEKTALVYKDDKKKKFSKKWVVCENVEGGSIYSACDMCSKVVMMLSSFDLSEKQQSTTSFL